MDSLEGAHRVGVSPDRVNVYDASSVSNSVTTFDRTQATPTLTPGTRSVVVGGGPTGIEVSGGIAALIHKVLSQDYHDLDVSRAGVVLVEASHRLLTPFDVSLQRYTERCRPGGFATLGRISRRPSRVGRNGQT